MKMRHLSLLKSPTYPNEDMSISKVTCLRLKEKRSLNSVSMHLTFMKRFYGI